MENKKNKITIITNGYFPVPATMGGAVEALVENLIRQNEVEEQLDLTVFSCYEADADEKSKEFKNTGFEFVRIPFLIKIADRILYYFGRNILRKGDGLAFRCICQRLYFVKYVASRLKEKDYGKLVLENHPVLFRILKLNNNNKKYAGRYYFHIHNEVTKGHGCETIMANCRKVLGVSGYINQTFREFLNTRFLALNEEKNANRALRKLIKKMSKIISIKTLIKPSKKNTEQEAGVYYDQNEYAVLRNRVDRERFAAPVSEERIKELRTLYDIGKEDIVLLFTGRFSPEKGVRELLEAFKKVKNKNVKLLVVGGFFFGSGTTSSFEDEVYRLAEDVKDRVRFTGYVDYSKIPEHYALADIVVIPSIWDDPAPLTVIEALTSGKALITTYSGGIPEYADESCSILLERDEHLVDKMTEAIEILAYNQEKRKQMGDMVKEKTAGWTLKQYYADFCKLME